MTENKLLEKLSQLDHLPATRDNLMLVQFATEVVNVILELRQEVEELDRRLNGNSPT